MSKSLTKSERKAAGPKAGRRGAGKRKGQALTVGRRGPTPPKRGGTRA